MIKFTTDLKEEMDRNIRTIESEEGDVLRRVYIIARMLEGLIGQLKTFIVKYTFKNDQEEILFFKEIKPRFFCSLLYYLKVYYIEVNKPMGSLELQSSYLSKELDNISEYLHKRLDFYRYYRSGSTHRDAVYFKRGVIDWDEQYIDGFYFERDPLFSSGCDFTVAKIHSYDMLQVYLREELDRITENKLQLTSSPSRQPEIIRWTDKKVRLIAILYALDTLGSFENGNLSLRKLQEFIEIHFDIKLGNIARAFNDIRLSQNSVASIEQMSEAILQRIAELDNRSHNHYTRNSSFSRSGKT